MPAFGKQSIARLETCDAKLQRLANELVKHQDCTILCGYRSPEEQQKLLDSGVSRVGPGQSKHNTLPSKAMDISPYPIDWNDRERWLMWCGFIKGVAAVMGIKIRMGADWDMDGYTSDQKFHDMPHIELED